MAIHPAFPGVVRRNALPADVHASCDPEIDDRVETGIVGDDDHFGRRDVADRIAEIGGELEIKPIMSRSAVNKLDFPTVFQKPRQGGIRHGRRAIGVEDAASAVGLAQQRQPSVRNVLDVDEIASRCFHINNRFPISHHCRRIGLDGGFAGERLRFPIIQPSIIHCLEGIAKRPAAIDFVLFGPGIEPCREDDALTDPSSVTPHVFVHVDGRGRRSPPSDARRTASNADSHAALATKQAAPSLFSGCMTTAR